VQQYQDFRLFMAWKLPSVFDITGWASGQSIQSVQSWVMRCWHGYLSAVRCRWFACGPADTTATPSSCLIKIQIGLTFLVPACPSCSGKEAVKWMSYGLKMLLLKWCRKCRNTVFLLQYIWLLWLLWLIFLALTDVHMDEHSKLHAFLLSYCQYVCICHFWKKGAAIFLPLTLPNAETHFALSFLRESHSC